MNSEAFSLHSYTRDQLRRLLLELMGPEEPTGTPLTLLGELLGAAGRQNLSKPPLWPSDISDDMTPVEFSVAVDDNQEYTLRMLGETIADTPSNLANINAAEQVITSLAERFGLSLERFRGVRDLFLSERPQGKFSLWYSLIIKPGSHPKFKAYFNPDVRGRGQAGQLVATALRRLGFAEAYDTVVRYGLRRGEQLDRISFFALDLDDHPQARVKVYVSHHRATPKDLELAAGALSDVDHVRITRFCSIVGGENGVFSGRPLVSGYSFTADDHAQPQMYNVYLPIRDYVCTDELARARVLDYMARHGLDTAILDRALDAVRRRPLHEGVGLIAHVSLRLDRHHRSGVTVYLSSEAYGGTPPRISDGGECRGCGEVHSGHRDRVRLVDHRSPAPPTDTGGTEIRPTFSPYRTQVVARIPITTRGQRERALERAGYNVFNLPADQVTIDLLTDSGTGAVSTVQEAAAVLGDRSYAGSRSFYRFRNAIRELTGYPHVLPVHQGRAAERILFSTLLRPGQLSVSNTHFDTTRANIELRGAHARDLPCAEAKDLDRPDPFKGNIDLVALRRMLADQHGQPVGLVLMTITNNGGGGQPVSMANLTAVSQLCRRYGVPFYLDAARFAENAWLVIQREPGYEYRSPREVACQAFALADGCVASLKKDGISPMGAFLGIRDPELVSRCEADLIATEGFRTYGGLAAHELERIVQGLDEVLDPDYLRGRAAEAAYLARRAVAAGVDVVAPPGLHAIYLNAGRLLDHLPAHRFPGHALACALYLEGGIRCVELGSLYLGTLTANNELSTPAPYELVRLALPRRVYHQGHLEYVGDVLAAIARNRHRIPGYRVVSAPPVLRHFNLCMAPVPLTDAAHVTQ